MPRSDTVIRNCQKAVASERPKHPKPHDVGFKLDPKHIPSDFLTHDLKTPPEPTAEEREEMEKNGEEEEPTKRCTFVFSQRNLLKLLYSAKLWTGDGS
jgi:hypothetical protein